MDLLYISNGNIPSPWAHTLQTMKMSEAFGQCVRRFALLVASDLRSLLRSPAPLFRHYGIERPFPVRRVPLGWRLPPAFFDRPDNRDFHLQAVRYARMRRPQLVYTRCHEVARQCLSHGLRVVFETHDGPGNPKTMKAIREFASRPSLAGVVTTSELLRDAFASEGMDPARIVASPNGIDLARFDGGGWSREEARRELGADPQRPLALYVGSLFEYKGIGTILEAAGQLPEWDILLVGGREHQIAEWQRGAPPNVRFDGFQPNARVPLYLAATDVALVANSAADRTARWTFPLKIYEYMAARRPVVASDIPAIRSILEPGREALLVPPDDPKALASAIGQLGSDLELARGLAAAARARVEQQTWEARAERILAALAPELSKVRRSGSPGQEPAASQH